MIWFTADTHFEHANIVLHLNRPFRLKDSVEDGKWISYEMKQKCADLMSEAIITNWNNVVKPSDSVYILGDFIWLTCNKTKGREKVKSYLSRLNGKKYLIQGNHDEFKYYRNTNIAYLGPYFELHFSHRLFVLSHYPFQSWNKQNYGSIHLHGHSHGHLEPHIANRFDVGVDPMQFKPISITTIMEAALEPD